MVRRNTAWAQQEIQWHVLTWRQVADKAPDISALSRYAHRGLDNSRLNHVDEVYALIARHPCLMQDQLAILTGTNPRRVREATATLIERGWIQEIKYAPTDTPAEDNPFRAGPLVELTRAGRREAAKRLLLKADSASRHHGLQPASRRGRSLIHLAHTVGANSVFVQFARLARCVTLAGGNDALETWRSAAACARGRCRPDGYGVYRRDEMHHGFFIEYDRGTERSRQYAAKIAAYYRFRDSGSAAREFSSFPAILYVTTSPVAEERFAWQAILAARQRGSMPLPFLLTTTLHIASHVEGVLGPIWWALDATELIQPARRRYWLPPSAVDWATRAMTTARLVNI
jgi:Replication-relaxation